MICHFGITLATGSHNDSNTDGDIDAARHITDQMIKRRTFIQILVVQSGKGDGRNRRPKESNPKTLHNHRPEKILQHDVKIRLSHVPSGNSLRGKTSRHHQTWIKSTPYYHKEKADQGTQTSDRQHIPDDRVWITSQIL